MRADPYIMLLADGRAAAFLPGWRHGKVFPDADAARAFIQDRLSQPGRPYRGVIGVCTAPVTRRVPPAPVRPDPRGQRVQERAAGTARRDPEWTGRPAGAYDPPDDATRARWALPQERRRARALAYAGTLTADGGDPRAARRPYLQYLPDGRVAACWPTRDGVLRRVLPDEKAALRWLAQAAADLGETLTGPVEVRPAVIRAAAR
ncbi:MAG: hypothetical protein K6V97_11275 [Actinomycetia bacterium]|nr:hypothetical protein [Actinomycetes bacterium]